MSKEKPSRWLTPARTRAAANVALLWSPLPVILAALGWRASGVGVAALILVAGGSALALIASHQARRFDLGWLVRRLNAREAGLEDSAELLFVESNSSDLARLQADRIAARIAAVDPATLADRWSTRSIVAAWLLGVIVATAIFLWPSDKPPPPLSAAARGQAAHPGKPRLTGHVVRIVPPAYTRLPPRYSQGLDVRAPIGSRIEWTLAFSPDPRSAALQLVGGRSVPFLRRRDGWFGSVRLDDPALYYLTAEGVRATQAAQRLEPILDEPPQVQVVEPASGLVMIRPGQRSWRVMFEASDDYVVDPMGRLTITTAIGEGENVTFAERTRTVVGTGVPRRRRFVANLDLASLGLKPGSDLVVQLTVADTRSPDPQVVRGPAIILRWPAPAAAMSDGLEMMAKQVMPAYFRSQRQVIIDTEELIRQRGKLSTDQFIVRSDTIGVDQRLLRLRYGEFMGMEAEDTPKPPPMPVSDKDPAGEPDAGAPAASDHRAGDGHDHGEAPEAPVFGGLGDVTSEYGHVHDESEAATLLDPDTRTLLKSALDAMWDAELKLRSGQPQEALPHELKALGFIKRIQQASRIYLPRIGSTQPPIDTARRLTGKREGIVANGAKVVPFAIDDVVPATAWRALASPEAIDLEGLDRWVRTNSSRIRDPLAVLAAVDQLRNQPGSGSLRDKLRRALWTVLTRPPVQVRRRDDGGALGRRYMKGLR